MESIYPTGAIVRIKLKNFITYSSAEFHPGPQLNMVIGPNGTGKSTLVCAIALGLAGKSEILGRAKELQDFVKHGFEKSYIEIELFSPDQNIIIKRAFKKGSNTSEWKLNGKICNEKSVKEAIAKLNIQVDNLCQFLPQDRVSSFAQMDSCNLLRETERAAGGMELIEFHDTLIRNRTVEKDLLASIKRDTETMEKLQSRNDELEREVSRFLERDSILKNMRLLELAVPWKRYDAATINFQIAKKEKNTLKEKVLALQKVDIPLQNLIQNLETKLKKREIEESNAKKAYIEKTNIDLKNAAQFLVQLENQTKDKLFLIANIDSEVRKRNLKIDSVKSSVFETEGQIAALENELIQKGLLDENLQQNYHGYYLNLITKISEINNNLEGLVNNIGEVHSRLREAKNNCLSINHEKQAVLDSLKRLDNARNRKIDIFLKNEYTKNTHRAIEWLTSNRHLFKGHVFDPISVEINLSDSEYADAIETTMGNAILSVFVTTCEEDYKLLQHELIDKMKLRVNIQCVSHPLSHWKSRLSREEIRSLGFEGFLLEYIRGPDEILSVICQRTRLHEIPVSKKDLRNHSSIEASNIPQYIAGKYSFSIKQAYGSSSSRSYELHSAVFLSQSVDVEEKKRLEREADVIFEKLRLADQIEKDIQNEEIEIRKIEEAYRREKGQLNHEKKELFAKKTEYEKKKQLLETLETSSGNIEDEKQKLRQELKNLNLHRAKKCIQYFQMHEQAVELFTTRTKKMLKGAEIQAALLENKETFNSNNKALAIVEAQFLAAVEKFGEVKDYTRNLLDEAKFACQDLTQEDVTKMEKYREKPLDEVEQLLAEEQTKADLILQTNPGVIEAYNERKVQIECIKERLSTDQAQITVIHDTMNEKKLLWETKLQEIVFKINDCFSKSFERMGCAGEVRLGKNEDYDKWGIEILVKFRDSEKLEVLNSHRQSGGERSVSTMLYLIALQELSKSPFRVVDEINQGMDPRNERMVHGQIVHASCGETTSQYFLITPKLLPDLEYHERMRVMCVMNGTWCPASFDSARYLKR